MTTEEWAEREIELACKKENPNWDGKSFDYGCSCYQSALKAYKSLCEDGHSGGSFNITENQLFDYCNLESGKPFYAIHISKLEIFDRPKYLTEYYKSYIETEKGIYYQVLTKAPQNYCYIEGEEQ